MVVVFSHSACPLAPASSLFGLSAPQIFPLLLVVLLRSQCEISDILTVTIFVKIITIYYHLQLTYTSLINRRKEVEDRGGMDG